MRHLEVLQLVAVASLFLACSSDMSDSAPGFGISSGVNGNQPGAGAQTASNTAGNGAGAPIASNAGSSSNETGPGGALPISSGGSTGSDANPGNAGSSSSATGGMGAGGAKSVSGAGGAQNTGGASAGSAVGRVGAELCPPGPFGNPLPDNPTATKVVGLTTGNNNTYNWEGVVWIGDSLYWSEIDQAANPPPARINRLTPPSTTFEAAFIANSGSNGLGVDAQGNIIAATHDVGAISVFALPSKARSQFGGASAQTFMNARFDSPNDLVLRGDGNLYFTDPSFQAPNPNPQQATRVYRISPDGVVSVIDSLSNPNGITLSPDGNTLYVDSGNGTGLRRYALAADGTPGPGSDVNIQNGGLQTPDGVAMDCAGNIYVVENSARRIRVLSPDGTELGRIQNADGGQFPQGLTNAAFGGADRKTLFISGFVASQQGGIYSIQLNVPGFPY